MDGMKKRQPSNPIRRTRFKWVASMDRWVVFNPARWPCRELLSRSAAIGIIVIFMGLRLYRFGRFPQHYADALQFYGTFKNAAGQPLYSATQIVLLWGVKLGVWLIETAIYLGYIAAYIGRAKAVRIASGVMQTAFPVLVAGLPVLIACMPYTLPRWAPYGSPRHLYYYLAITALILLGGLINLIGVLTLRRAFTIMSEARELIVHGIFRYVRHPIYTGHFIMFLGSTLLRLHPVTIGLYMFFCIGQVVRAKIEESKLSRAFPDYADYQRRTGMFLPK